MRLAPDIAEEHAPAGPFVPSFVRSLEAAVAARLPFFAPYLPLMSRVARFLAVGVVGLAADTGVFAALFHQGAGAPFARNDLTKPDTKAALSPASAPYVCAAR